MNEFVCPMEIHSTAPYKQAGGAQRISSSHQPPGTRQVELPSRVEGCSDLCHLRTRA